MVLPARARPSLGLTLSVVAGLTLWALAWPSIGGAAPLHAYSVGELFTPTAHEAAFYVALVPLQLLLALWLWQVLSAAPSLEERARPLLAHPRRTALALALLAGGAALLLTFRTFGGHPFTEDEKTYLFQARLLLEGRLSVPVPPELDAFRQPFLVVARERLSAQYYWGYPALLAPGEWAGLPALVPAALLGVTVFASARAAEAYSGDARAGLAAAALTATSPLLLLQAGTLHNANLATTCTAATLWALATLYRRRSLGAAVALGLATGLALHNRRLDQVGILAGSALLLAGGCRWRRAATDTGRPHWAELARRLAAAVAIVVPFLLAQRAINLALSGDPNHDGYWLFNTPFGWKLMGFGTGPFGAPHTPRIAAAKTLTYALHVLFYTAGTPWAFGLVGAALALVPRPERRRLVAPLLLAGTYLLGYFFFAGWSVTSVGPVYFGALIPALTATLGVAAARLHRALAGRASVPAALAALLASAAVLFWPTQIQEGERVGRASGACTRLVQRAGLERALVFVQPMGAPSIHSWAFQPPLPSPDFDDAVLFAFARGVEADRRVAQHYGAGRPIFLTRCVQEPDAVLYRYDPRTGATERFFPPEPGA